MPERRYDRGPIAQIPDAICSQLNTSLMFIINLPAICNTNFTILLAKTIHFLKHNLAL